MIPKIIHYCWLSNDAIPEAYQKYVASWGKKLPGYQFILWNTENFDINSLPYTKQAFEVKMYAFACDYIRLYAVYNYGGIYLDMDMEVVKPFDELLDAEIMLGYENHISERIEAGCFGAVKGHPYIRKCMEYYETRHFFDPIKTEKIIAEPPSERLKHINPAFAPVVLETTLKQYSKTENYKIYPREYFTAKNILTGVIEQKETTFTIHHFATQYSTEEDRKIRDTHQRLNRMFGENNVIGKIYLKLSRIRKKINRHGIIKTAGYYFNKYVKKTPADDT